MTQVSLQSHEVETLSRRIVMLKFLSSESRPFSNDEVRDYLETKNYRVSARTVHTDLVKLSYVLPSIVKTSGKRTLWRYEDESNVLADVIDDFD